MTSIYGYSATAASNNSAAPDGAPEGMAASGVNDTIRKVMANLAEFAIAQVAGGTADALTLTPTNTLAAYVDGMQVHFRAAAANATTTPTLAISGLTARTIVKNGGSALVAGDIAGALAEYIVRYNLANTRWELLNPKVVADTSTFSDSAFTVQDNGDATKQLQFQVSGVTTGTTRTLTIPNLSGTIGIQRNRAYGSYTTNADLSTVMVYDDTIPQSSEGTQVLSVSITTQSASSRVRISYAAWGTLTNGSDTLMSAVFRDSATDALQDSVFAGPITYTTGVLSSVSLVFEDAPGSVGTFAYKLRIGATSTCRLNGGLAGRKFGGASAATLVLEELLP